MTNEGFLEVEILAARTGIQQYHSSEIGVEGDKIISVLRSHSEVFSKDSLDSWRNKDLTFTHPDSLLDSSNYRELTVGTIVGDPVQHGSHVKVQALIKDADTIRAIQDGTMHVSAGYENIYVKDEGTFEGTPYQYVQKNITINHLAVVPLGRAKTTVILDNGDTMTKIEELTAEIESLQAENAELKKRPTMDAIHEIVATTEDAKKIDPSLNFNGLSVPEIKRLAVGTSVTLDHSDDVVDFVFEQQLALTDEPVTQSATTLDSTSQSLTIDLTTGVPAHSDARKAYLQKLEG